MKDRESLVAAGLVPLPFANTAPNWLRRVERIELARRFESKVDPATVTPRSRLTEGAAAHATDVWSGKELGAVSVVTRTVPAHGNIFLTLSPPK